MPTHNELMVIDPAFTTSEVGQLIKTWGYLHPGRRSVPATMLVAQDKPKPGIPAWAV
jgi:hypothetical protein